MSSLFLGAINIPPKTQFLKDSTALYYLLNQSVENGPREGTAGNKDLGPFLLFLEGPWYYDGPPDCVVRGSIR